MRHTGFVPVSLAGGEKIRRADELFWPYGYYAIPIKRVEAFIYDFYLQLNFATGK